MHKNIKITLIHISGWVAYLLTVVIGAEATNKDFWVYLFSAKIPVILLFYICLYYVYPAYLGEKKYFRLTVILLLLIAFLTLLRFFIAAVLTKFHFIDEISNAVLQNEIWKQLRLCLGFAGISLALWYANRNIVVENELLNAELSALKHQINPHFLFNTFNYMYAKAMPLSNDLAKAIGKLAEMMRYSIGVSDGSGFVSIENEVSHIERYIELQQLRFDNLLNINLHIKIQQPGKKILQLVLMTFIENVFKHGELQEREAPVRIDLIADDEKVNFTLCNKIRKGIKERSSGIGLSNTIKRLQIAYPNKHELLITENEEIYKTELKLKW